MMQGSGYFEVTVHQIVAHSYVPLNISVNVFLFLVKACSLHSFKLKLDHEMWIRCCFEVSPQNISSNTPVNIENFVKKILAVMPL